MNSSRKHKSQFTTEMILDDFAEYQEDLDESSYQYESEIIWWNQTKEGPAHYTCMLSGCALPVSGTYKFCSKEHAREYRLNYKNEHNKEYLKNKRRRRGLKKTGRKLNRCLDTGIECRIYEDADKCACQNCKNTIKSGRWMT